MRPVVHIIGLVLLAAVMLRSSLAVVIRPLDPALALRIDPDNGEVQSSRAEQLIRQDPSAANRAFAEHLSRLALRRSPVDAAAARMLATTRDLAGDAAGARRLMAYSESLSRRDLPVQLWLIEDAVAHNDIPGALRHYDIALRGSVTTAPLLFPVLVAATAQPPVVDGLIDTLAAKPLWADRFVEQVSRDGRDYDGLTRLLTGLARRGYRLPDGAVATATARIAGAGRYDQAWQVYAAARRDAVRSAIRDPGFARAAAVAAPFEWAIAGSDGVAAEPRQDGTGSRLAYTAATGAGGAVARQLLLLPAGAFVIGGHSFDVAPGSPPATMRLSCAGNGQLLGTIAATGDSFAGRVAIPAGCPAQWLQIVVDGGDSPTGASGEIGDVRVRPAGGAARS